jgi:anti-anti-sigma regulatory factor
MTSKKKGTIGFDPLAWMKGPSLESKAKTTHGAGVPTPDSGPQTPDSILRTPDSPSAVQLGDSLTIEQSAAMHAELGRHLGAKNVVLDAGSLTRVDTAGLQLLTAFMRAAEGRGARVEWRAPQPALRESARRLGLEGALRLA